MFRRLRIWFECRRTLSSAERREDPQLIADLLGRHPQFVERVQSLCLRHLESCAEWLCLIYCTGFVLARCDAARAVVQRLIRDKQHERGGMAVPIPWSKLTEPHVRAFIAYLDRFAARSDTLRFLLLISESQLRAIRPAESDKGYLLWFTAVARRGLVRVDDYRTLLGLARRDSDRVNVRVAGWVAGAIGLFEYADLARAADLLRHHGSPQWTPYLTSKWLSIEDDVRRTYRNRIHAMPNEDQAEHGPLQVAAGALLAAMGRCATGLPDTVDFKRDEGLTGELTRAIERHREIVTRYNQLVARYRGAAVNLNGEFVEVRDSALVQELQDLKRSIEHQDSCVQEHRQRRSDHSVPASDRPN